MRELSIDLETFSTVDLSKAGVYRYTEDEHFTILLFAYAFDNEPVKIVDLANGETIPKEVRKAITDPGILKTAWNALFEIVCLERYLDIEIDVSQWRCTQIGATMVGLPASLAQAGLALKLDTIKDPEGKRLLTLFTRPQKLKSGQTSAFPLMAGADTHPEKWAKFKGYCIQDVIQERAIKNHIRTDVEKAFTTEERFIWWCDHKINRRGIRVDQKFTLACIKLAQETKTALMQEAIQLTKLKNPNSTAQIKGWLEAAIGESIESLQKKHIPGLKALAMDNVTERVLELREELSKSSVKKYDAIMNAVGKDGRVKGLHKYFGAQKTGRWSSTIVQIHNLKRNELEQLDLARRAVTLNQKTYLDLCFEEGIQDILSQLIRTAFIASPGHSLIMSDFSSIEARITAWLAGEKWRMEIFNSHGKIYEASASKMFKVPIEEVTKGSIYRAKGKIAELALGFGGGVNSLKNMGGEAMGLTEGEMTQIVKGWRRESPSIVRYWAEVEEKALRAVEYPGKTFNVGNVNFQLQGKILWMKLPSGRYIAYRDPKVEERYVPKLDTYKPTLSYIGMEQTRQQITRLTTYGGKLTENIVQGTARDLLAAALVRMNNAKFDVVLHVHDEIVPEVPDSNVASSVLKINKIMAVQPKWATGLPLAADSTVSKYYKK